MEHSASFSDFPDEVQIVVLSLLSLTEISAFACTSRHFSSLCSHKYPSSPLYRSMCNRRWGFKTLIPRGASNFPLLYKTLDRWDTLIGFWRQMPNAKNVLSPPLVLFEWGQWCITGSRVFPLGEPGSYNVVKQPFLWLGMSKTGEPLSFLSVLDPESGRELVPVSVSFIGANHVVVEESGGALCLDSREEDDFPGSGSPPDQMMFEIYQYLANRRIPGGDKGLRKQRRKKVKRMRRAAEHFVKIENSCPSPARPLQGLWKFFRRSMLLEFYLVTYDDVGAITFRRVDKWGEPCSASSPVFWALNTVFLTSPFSKEEEDLYSSRVHLPLDHCEDDKGTVSRILCINSGKHRKLQGRIWEYENGTFAFGLLRNNFIVDLKRIALNGTLLDTVEYCSSSSISSSSGGYSSCSSISSYSP